MPVQEQSYRPYAEAAEQQFVTVRERLKQQRQALGLSMSELARKIGVSPSMISQIERGESFPSVETLFALAAALGAKVDFFFSTSDPPRPTPGETTETNAHRYVVRRGERAGFDLSGGLRWERLTPEALDGIEFIELIYQPRAVSNENLYQHPGFEMLFVTEGRLDVYIGFERHELGVGDSVAFHSCIPHRYANPTDSVSRGAFAILRDGIGATGPPE